MCDIFLLEDDALVRMILLDALAEAGFAVEEASSAHQVLAHLSASHPCRLMVTDIDLGTAQDGFEVARRVREHRPDLPVLYVSGRPAHWAGRTFQPDERFLTKPFPTEDMIAQIHSLGVRPCHRS
jgi:DNA-binding NtrC family response regulator